MEVACGIIRNKKNKILMGLRSSSKEDGGYWEFPGGKKNACETIKDCLHREIFEELNIHISIIEEIYSYNNGKYFLRFFTGNIKDEKNLQMNVHEELRFVDVEEIYNLNIFEEDKKLLGLL